MITRQQAMDIRKLTGEVVRATDKATRPDHKGPSEELRTAAQEALAKTEELIAYLDAITAPDGKDGAQE